MKRLYTKRIGFSKGLIIGILFVLLPMTGLCITYTWINNGTYGYWNVPSNWSPNTGYPNQAGDDAVFSSGSCVVVINVAISINSITMTGTFAGTVGQGAGSTITIAGVSTFDKGFFAGNDADITFNSGLTISGTSFQGTSANLNINGGSLSISSGFFLSGGVGTVVITANGSNGISGTGLYTAIFNNLIIQGGSTGTFGFNSPFTVASSLKLKTTAAVDFTISIPAGVTPVVNGTTSYLDTGSGGNILVDGPGTLQLNGNLDISGDGTGTAGGGAGTIIFGGIDQSIIGSSAAQYANLPNVVVACSGNLTLSNTITILNDWSITSGTIVPGTSTLVFSASPAIVNVTSVSPWTLYNAIFIGNGNRINLATSPLTVTNLLTLGATTVYNATNISIPPGINTKAAQLLGGSSTVAYVNILNGTVNITSSIGGYSLLLNDAGSGLAVPTIGGSDVAGTIEFSGILNQQIVSSAALYSGIPSAMLPNILINKTPPRSLNLGTGIIPLYGNWTYQAGNVNPNSSTLYFYNTTGSQTITTVNGGSSMNAFNLTINTPTLIQGSDVYLKGDFSGGAGINLDPSSSNYNMSIEGDWNFAGHYNPSARTPTVTFSGANAQSIFMSVLPFYNLTINKGANDVTLNTPVTVSNLLTLTQGNIKTSLLPTSYLLTLHAPGSSIAGTGLGSTASYVDGPMVWDINTSATATYNYPVGAGGDWSPFSLTIGKSSSAQTLYTVEVNKASPITAFTSYTLGTGIVKISNIRYWTASQAGAAPSSVRATAYFNANDQVTDPLPASLSLAVTTGTTWTNIAGTTTYDTPIASPYSGNVLEGADRIPGSTDYYTFDDVGTGINPLPITLSSFKAAFDNTGTTVNVLWTTESEEAGTYFTLERADKSLSFEALTTVKPAYGDGKNGREEYSYVDQHPLSGLSYYRLKQTSIKGEVTYNTIVSVNSTIERVAGVYPNPGDGQAMRLLIPSILQHEDNVTVTIRDQLGEDVVNETATLAGKDEIELHMVSPLPGGIYYVSFGGGGIFYSMKYIVR